MLESLISLLHARLLQSCPNLCNPMDCSLPDSSVHEISQARILDWKKKKRILDWVAILFQEIFPSWGSNPCLFVSPALARGFFTISATWKASINLLSSAFSKTSTTDLFLRLYFHRTSVKFYHVVYHLKLY